MQPRQFIQQTKPKDTLTALEFAYVPLGEKLGLGLIESEEQQIEWESLFLFNNTYRPITFGCIEKQQPERQLNPSSSCE